MSEFVTASADQASISGSYKDKELSMKATSSILFQQSSSLATTFHSTTLEYYTPYETLKFSSSCRSHPNQLVPSYREAFEILKLPFNNTGPIDNGIWEDYMNFMKNHGSHIIKQNVIGSAFYEWVSSTSTDSEIVHSMKADACAKVEGIDPESASKSELDLCVGYNETDRKTASTKNYSIERVVMGGDESLRVALQTAGVVTQDMMTKFSNSANETDQAISSQYMGIWDVLHEMYYPLCANNDLDACKHTQRAKLLEAAYKGWMAYDCKTVTSRLGIIQTMKYDETDIHGLRDIQCWAKKTGCETDADCHHGGVAFCYAYGTGALDEAYIEGTEKPLKYKTVVRNKKTGGHRVGINNSCKYKGIRHCDCIHDWTGGQLDRIIWASSDSGIQTEDTLSSSDNAN